MHSWLRITFQTNPIDKDQWADWDFVTNTLKPADINEVIYNKKQFRQPRSAKTSLQFKQGDIKAEE